MVTLLTELSIFDSAKLEYVDSEVLNRCFAMSNKFSDLWQECVHVTSHDTFYLIVKEQSTVCEKVA